MKTIKQLIEEIAAMKAEAEALCLLAEEEDRDLNGDEQARFDKIAGVGKTGEADFKAGQIAGLESDLQRAKRRTELASASLQTRIEDNDVDLPKSGADQSGDCFSGITVPRSASSSRKLKGFSGEHASRDAYGCGQFVAAILGNQRAQKWCDENNINPRNVMTEGTESLGGVTVPEPLEAAIIVIMEMHGVFRQFAGRKVMAAPTDTTPRRVGGMQVFYPDEAGGLTRSDLRLDKVQLNAKKYACLSEISTELNEDSLLEMISMLVSEMGLAKAQAEDVNGFTGDGTAGFAGTTGLGNAIAGVVGTPSRLVASTADLGALVLGDFEKCEAELPEFMGVDPAWYVNKSVWGGAMAPLMRAAGGNTVSDVAGLIGKEFLGYPVRTTQVMPKSPGSGEVIAYFGDLQKSSTLGTRRGMSFATSTEGDFFTNDTIGVKCTQRIAIENHEAGQEALAASGDQMAVEASAGPILSLVAP